MVDWADTKGCREEDERGVYVTNVDERVDESLFKDHFSKFGVVDKVVLGRTISHATRKDFAIVNFVTRKAAQKCVNEGSRTTLRGR